MIERRLSEMGTTDGGALRQVELQAAVAQRLGHADRARRAVGAEGAERAEQGHGPVADAVAEDMEVLEVAVDRRELNRRHDAEATSRARLQRLVDAVHRVMVGELSLIHI